MKVLVDDDPLPVLSFFLFFVRVVRAKYNGVPEGVEGLRGRRYKREREW